MGTITIRYRMDWLEPRKALLAAAMPPPSNVVSVARAIDFAVADYTIKGPVSSYYPMPFSNFRHLHKSREF